MRSILLIVFILFAVNSCDRAKDEQQSKAVDINQQVKIGVITTLTAGPSSSGEAVKNSILLADELYDKEDRVVFLIEDDRFEPKNTVSAAKKLITIDGVRGLVVYGSPTSLAVNSIAEREKVPMIGLSIVKRVVADKLFVMKHWLTSQKQNHEVVQEARRRGYRSVAIVSTINDAMLALRDHFLASNKFNIVLNEELAIDDFDFRTIVSRVAQKGPDAVYLLLYPPQPGVFAKLLRQAGYEGDLFGVHNLEDPSEVKASEGALYGVWYVHGDDSAAGEYYEQYRKCFGKEPALGGTNGFDVAKLFIEGAYSGDINRYLHSVAEFEGTYGTYGATKENDFAIPAAVKVITNSGFDILRVNGSP